MARRKQPVEPVNELCGIGEGTHHLACECREKWFKETLSSAKFEARAEFMVALGLGYMSHTNAELAAKELKAAARRDAFEEAAKIAENEACDENQCADDVAKKIRAKIQEGK